MNQAVAVQNERTEKRFVAKLPTYTQEKLDELLEVTGMTQVQLMIVMVDKAYASLVEEKAA